MCGWAPADRFPWLADGADEVRRPDWRARDNDFEPAPVGGGVGGLGLTMGQYGRFEAAVACALGARTTFSAGTAPRYFQFAL